ncbi:MAG: 3-deoxy-manno-octulosonate cytidylyltransferase [Legionellales bacterium]|nr:3-deoxy-manno-octulosonate cytidylyltransferase [Legionellales bacterium]|tara:strand:+ start:7900 stop:8676 length:777 start_codon:yes stop_codon:yes gene_type:complete
MKFHVVIPARFQSSRLPGKVLLDIAGKPMLQHVYERAQESGAASILIATDDLRIYKVAQEFGADVCMTDINHISGTDRIAEAVSQKRFADDDIIVNLQGDEALMPAEVIHQVASDLAEHEQASMTTVCEAIKIPDEIFDPHIVKVVLDDQNYAMYFSRAPIPWVQGLFGYGDIKSDISLNHYRHVGIYAYHVAFLQQFVAWPHCPIENMESLEQLRVIWHGKKIHVAKACKETFIGVDTQDDLDSIREYFGNHVAADT